MNFFIKTIIFVCLKEITPIFTTRKLLRILQNIMFHIEKLAMSERAVKYFDKFYMKFRNRKFAVTVSSISIRAQSDTGN